MSVRSTIRSVSSYMESRPDLSYRPGPTVAAFLACDQLLTLLRAANQVGKSLAGAAKANRYSLAHPKSLGLVVVADLENHYPEICEKIWAVIARAELHPSCKYVEGKGFVVHGRRGIQYKNGSRWVFRTGKGEQMALAGITVNWVWIDEIPQRAHFGEALRAAQRHLAPVWMTFTPIGRPAAFLRKRIEGDPDTGAPPEDADPVTGAPLWKQFNPQLSAVECPWMTEEQIAIIVARTDPDEAPQRLRGAWEGPTPGRAFNGMKASNIIKELPQGDWNVTVSIDHGEGIGRQHAVLLYGSKKTVVVVDEYVNSEATTPEKDADGIMAMLERQGIHPLQVDAWIGDVNSLGKMGAGKSVNQELGEALSRKVGTQDMIRITTPDKKPGSVNFGLRMLNFALHRNELLFMACCVKTTRSFWHHRDEKDEFKHGVDGVRYGAIPQFRSMPAYSHISYGVY